MPTFGSLDDPEDDSENLGESEGVVVYYPPYSPNRVDDDNGYSDGYETGEIV
jgi:hypothetical protein